MKRKKTKQTLILCLIALVFFAGVVAILYPSFSNLLSLFTANTTIAQYKEQVEKMPEQDIQDILKKARKFNAELADGKVDKDLEKCLNGTDDIMCYLEIPKIKVYLPVYFGTSDEVLEKGCGYIQNTSLPIGGKSTHSVISGHTGLPTAEMLTELDQIKNGDVFYIHVLGEVLAYQVDNVNSVFPNDTESLKIIDGEDHLTLVTCTPYGINDRRLLVRGTRIPYTPNVATPDNPTAIQPPSEKGIDQNIINQILIISGIALAAIVIFVIAAVWVHIVMKKRNAQNDEDNTG
ncbi:MAG: class C sortase [Acutalibacteraceae bacterium]